MVESALALGVVLLAAWLISAGFGAYVAAQKNRDPIEGAVFGFVLGPLGVLIVALLPRGRFVTTPAKAVSDPAEADDRQASAFLRGIEPKRARPPLTEAELPPWLAGAIDLNLEAKEVEAIDSLRIRREPPELQ